jgi:AcrR family transcriptional regulator
MGSNAPEGFSMVRKTVFSREDVVAAGLEVVRRDGLTQLTARKVAEQLGASTAPVYSNFSHMEDLTVAVKRAAVDMLLELTRVHATDDPFLNIGVGVLEFARQHPQLYVALFMQASGDCEAGPAVMEKLLEYMSGLPELNQLGEVERIILLRKMATFTHGLATQVCNGYVEEYEWDNLIQFLREVGEVVTADAFARSPRSAEDLALLGSFGMSPREMLNTVNDQAKEADGDD